MGTYPNTTFVCCARNNENAKCQLTVLQACRLCRQFLSGLGPCSWISSRSPFVPITIAATISILMWVDLMTVNEESNYLVLCREHHVNTVYLVFTFTQDQNFKTNRKHSNSRETRSRTRSGVKDPFTILSAHVELMSWGLVSCTLHSC